MPPTAAFLAPQTALALVAYILQANGATHGRRRGGGEVSNSPLIPAKAG